MAAKKTAAKKPAAKRTPRRTAKQIAEDRRDTAKANLEATLAERKLSALAKYDVTDPNVKKKRRRPQVERGKEETIQTHHQRLQAVNIGRDIERNYTSGRAQIHQIKVNVVGEMAKAQFNTEDEDWNKKAGDFFNGDWAHNCDSCEDRHLSELGNLVIASVMREGNVVSLFDNLLRDDGKLMFWEADQIVTVTQTEWANQKDHIDPLTGTDKKPYLQDNGVLRDKFGRVYGYCVTGKHGQQTVSLKDATILPRPAGKLLRLPWRFGQSLGIAPMLTAAAHLEDSYEMLAKELQSAKVQATFAGVIKQDNAVMDFDDPTSTAGAGDLPENQGKTEAEIEEEQAGGGEEKNYDRLEALTGGAMEYMERGDSWEPLKTERPNVHMQEFVDHVLASSGASIGLAKAYALLSADKSYTAFRGDMVLSWRTITWLQKWIERHFFDWAARQAIAWAVATGKLDACTDPTWARRISWSFPTMPQVDPLKEEQAIRLRLKNGRTTYKELLGPDWENKLMQLDKEVRLLRKPDLTLALLETVSGTIIDEDTKAIIQQGDTDEEE